MCVLASISVCNYPAQREVGSDSVWTAPWLRLNVDPMAGIPNLSVWRDAEVGSIGAMKRSSDAKASTCRPCSAMYSFWFQTRAQKQRRRKARHNVSRSDLAIKRNLCNLYKPAAEIFNMSPNNGGSKCVLARQYRRVHHYANTHTHQRSWWTWRHYP